MAQLEETPAVSLRYQQIAQMLKERIRSGELRPNDRLPTTRVLRQEHGITQHTVDKAIGLLEREGLVVRSDRSGVYVAKPSARPTTGLIGFSGVSFTRTEFSAYWTSIMEGVEGLLRQWGKQLVLLDESSPHGWDQVDGLIVNGMMRVPADRIGKGLPVVSLFRINQSEPSVRLDVDDFGGMAAAVRHLLSLGHQRISLLNNARNEGWVDNPRTLAYRETLRAAGIEPEPGWEKALEGPGPHLHFMNSGRESMRSWLRQGWRELGCTAILAQNDDTAWGVITALKEEGLSVPGDVSVVGFDDTVAAECCEPPLTTIRVPLRSVGETAVRCLEQWIANDSMPPAETLLATELVIRESTAPPR